MADYSGDPQTISDAAKGFTTTAPEVGKAATLIQQLVDGKLTPGVWQDEARKKFGEIAKAHQEVLKGAESRLENLGNALARMAASMPKSSRDAGSVLH